MTGPQKPGRKRRQRVNPVSAKRRRQNSERKTLLESLYGREETWTCMVANSPSHLRLMGPCYGAVHGHEILPRGRGGSITDPANVVPLCNRHNDWCSEFPVEAHRLGLLKHAWDA